jgi:periplasmic divalent cation tolerance protein
MYGVVLITCPRDKAEAMARIILEKRVAACVNIFSQVISLYWWEDKIVSDTESFLIVKTKEDSIGRLQEIVKENHPYDIPEIIFIPITKGNQDYLEWIKKETKH